jgi:trk system potassium uptake protein TrkA
MVMALVEHEVPEHELVHLLALKRENLEIVEVEIGHGAEADGKRVQDLHLPEGARLISVMRNGSAEIAVGQTKLERGDQVLAIIEPGREDHLRQLLCSTRKRQKG